MALLCCSLETFSSEYKNSAYNKMYRKSTVAFNGFHKEENLQELYGCF